MNSTTLRRLAVAITLAAAAGVCVARLWRGELALKSYEAKIAAREAANQRLKTTLMAQLKLQGAAPVRATASSASTSVAVGKTGQGATKDFWITKTMQRLPEYAPVRQMRTERHAMREYGEWFRMLNVTPERLAQIKQAVAETIDKRQRAYEALIETGVADDTQEFVSGAVQINHDMDAALNQTLTPDEFGSLKQFDLAKDWNRYLPEIDAFFEDRGAPPLSPEQRRAFLAATVESKSYIPEGTPPAQVPLFRMRNERIAALAAQSLPSAQREALIGYMAFYNQRITAVSALLNPSAPDALAYVGTRAF